MSFPLAGGAPSYAVVVTFSPSVFEDLFSNMGKKTCYEEDKDFVACDRNNRSNYIKWLGTSCISFNIGI